MRHNWDGDRSDRHGLRRVAHVGYGMRSMLRVGSGTESYLNPEKWKVDSSIGLLTTTYTRMLTCGNACERGLRLVPVSDHKRLF